MKVVLNNIAYKKIQHWVTKADFEVSGMGKVLYNQETDTYTITDAYLVKQEGTGSTTDLDATAMAQLLYATRDVPGMLNFWWHSHVNMSVFWSGTDRTTIEDLGKHGLCVATVFNKKNEMRSAVCALMDSAMAGARVCFWDEVQTVIGEEIMDTSAWDAEYTEKVTEKKYLAASIHYGMGRQWERDTSDEGKAAKKVTKEEKQQRSLDDYSTEYTVPYWAQKDAELLDMTPLLYWHTMDRGTDDERAALDKRLDRAAWTKYQMSYEEWCYSNLGAI